MKLNLKKPLAFFDLETTGTNVSRDRIVELAVLKVMPDGEQVSKVAKINPTIPIPAETSAIHGIYDEDVADAPTFKNIAKSLAQFMEGCDLAGFNSNRFDVPLLVEEFLRVGIDFNINNRKLIDVQRLFHMMEKRTLSAAYKFYCDKNLDGAHSAEVDTMATFEVLESMMDRYKDQTMVDNLGKELGKIENDMEALSALTSTNMVDLAGRISLKNGIEVFNFGKHKGKSVMEVFKKESSYYDWMLNGDFPLDTKRKLTEIKLRGFNK